MTALNSCRRRSLDALACTDASSLGGEDSLARSATAYVDRTVDRSRSCATCQQYIEPTDSCACGACKLLKGPVHPMGTCKLYSTRG
jgi:hypothetical protein